MSNTFTYTPALDPTGTAKLRARAAQFGDGYAQYVADGINAKVQTWSLVFHSLNARTALIQTFLDGQVGISFLWTPPAPQNVQGYYMCTGYTIVPHGAGASSLQAVFQQVFSP